MTAEYAGTVIGPDGRRYAPGAPELSEPYVDPPEVVRARGERVTGAVPTVTDEGGVEWAEPAEGGGGGVSTDFTTAVASWAATVDQGVGQGQTYGTLLSPIAIPIAGENIGAVVGAALVVCSATYSEEWEITNGHLTHQLGGEFKVIARNIANGDYLAAVAGGLYPVEPEASKALTFTQQAVSGSSISLADGLVVFAAGTYEVTLVGQVVLIEPS